MNNNKSKNKYGWDNLSKFLFFAGLFFAFGKYSRYFGIPLLAYAYYRTMSKNLVNRASEQAAFDNLIRSGMNAINSIFKRDIFGNLKNKFGGKSENKSGFNNNNNSTMQDKNYVVIICPKCSQKLRLPAKKGNMEVKCPKCKSKIKTRT